MRMGRVNRAYDRRFQIGTAIRTGLLLAGLLAFDVIPVDLPGWRSEALEVEDPAAGRFTELRLDSQLFGPVDLLVYTPPDYFAPANVDRYPVVYWLHGSGGDHLTLKIPLESLPTPGFDGAEKLDALIMTDADVEPLLMVGIGAPGGDWDDSLTTLVTEEVPAFIDRHFRTIARRGGRGLEGFSLGSEGVSRYVTARPDVFATAALLGGGFLKGRWTAAQVEILRDKLEVAQFVGDQDAFQADAVALAAELDLLGVPNELNLLGGVGHSAPQIYAIGGPQILAFHTDRWRLAQVVDAGPDQQMDAAFPIMGTLSGTIADPEGLLGSFTTLWEQVSGPGTAIFLDASALSTTVTLPAAGTYHFRLTATGDVVLCDVVEVVAVDTGDALEVHLTFDAGDGADASGNGRDGTLAGGPSPLADGRVGGALSFDGVDDAVTVADFTYGSEWTISLWARPADLTGTGYEYVASHNGFDQQSSFNLYLPEDAATFAEDPDSLLVPPEEPAGERGPISGRVRAALRDADDGPGPLSTASAPVDDGDWHHLILTVPAGGGHRIIVDGADLAGGSNGGGAFDPPGDLFFGTRSVSPTGRYFEGDLDDIRLYSRGLLAEEVEQLAALDDSNDVPSVEVGADLSIYQQGGAVLEGVATDDGPLTLLWSQESGPGTASFVDAGAPVTAASFDTVGTYTLRLTADDGTHVVFDELDVTVLNEIEPGLVGYWPLEDGASSVASDASGLEHDGQLVGTSSQPFAIDGVDGRALNFNGADSQAVIIDGSDLLAPRPGEDDFSVLLWLRTWPGAEGSILSRGANEASARQLQLFLLDPNDDDVSDLTAIVGGETNDQPKQLGVRVDDGLWHHVALVHDANTLTNRFYVDGVQVGTPQASGTSTQNVSLMIGARRADAGNTGIAFPLTGDVDDVRFYNRELDAVEIQLVITATECAEGACDPFFRDDFETGDASRWDDCAPSCP